MKLSKISHQILTYQILKTDLSVSNKSDDDLSKLLHQISTFTTVSHKLVWLVLTVGRNLPSGLTSYSI